MSTIGATETKVRTYGNWRHPRLAGLGKLSFVQTMALLALLIVSILVYGSLGLAHAAVLLLFGLSVLGAMEIRDAHGVSIWERGMERVSFARRRRTRRTIYRSGLSALSRVGARAFLACSQDHASASTLIRMIERLPSSTTATLT